MAAQTTKKDELRLALRACKQYFVYAGIFSAAVNVLLLTPIIYMMTVFDRVVSSGSLPTLSMLSLLMVSSIPYRTPKTLRLSRETMILSALFWGMLLLVAVQYRVSTSFVVLLGTYAVSGPIEAVFSRKKVTLIDDQTLSLDELFATDSADEVIER